MKWLFSPALHRIGMSLIFGFRIGARPIWSIGWYVMVPWVIWLAWPILSWASLFALVLSPFFEAALVYLFIQNGHWIHPFCVAVYAWLGVASLAWIIAAAGVFWCNRRRVDGSLGCDTLSKSDKGG